MSYNSLEYILSIQYKPTIKQLKLTNAYKNGDYKFKNIALQMYQSMISKLENENNYNTIITCVFNYFNMKRAKDILIKISEEHHKKLINKKEKQLELEKKREIDIEQEKYFRSQHRFQVNYVPQIQPEYKITKEDIDSWENL